MLGQHFPSLIFIVAGALTTVLPNRAFGTVILETVPVGNAGNSADPQNNIVGAGTVNYGYEIGKFEITTGQYTEFLNAVATTDPFGLYNTQMSSSDFNGCNIRRIGTVGNYTYSVGDGNPSDVANWASRPVNTISWGDAARFANWMHNGQPTGPQGLSTTEDGSYLLNGATSVSSLLAVTRKPTATWVIPSDNEWYKAAYHKGDGVTGNYWFYPYGSHLHPNNGNPEGDTGNSANYNDGDYAIGSPYWRTNVGYFEYSASPYGTYDQGGNVWEWTEAVIGIRRGIRGGWFGGANMMGAIGLATENPTAGGGAYGFRLSLVPEPASITMFGFCVFAIKRRFLHPIAQ